jgi:uncharacterized protein (TIGR03435 family)
MSRDNRNVDDYLRRELSSTPSQMDAGLSRILAHLRSEPDAVVAPPIELDAGTGVRTRWLSMAAALLVMVAVGTTIVWRSADDALFRVVEGEVYQGRTIRSNGGAGSVLALTDGSRVEMRSQSELTFERADDGVRIRLGKGGIIVSAAKQRDGHLYVQTKDVTVSVVGTVFLVNAEEQGSRVVVIEGEVRVQQGSTEKTLRPGEQVASNPTMPALLLSDEVAWSRQAGAHVARLQQTVPQLPFRPGPKEDPLRFEVASIRHSDRSSDSGGRGGGDGTSVNQRGCGISSPTIDPRRFSVTKTTVYSLIVWAYGSKGLHAPGCGAESKLDLISGGPDWIKSELYDVAAVIPERPSGGIQGGRDAGTEMAIRQMLQAFLADRLNLIVHREAREMPVYSLSVANEALRNVERSVPAQWLTNGGIGPGSLRDPGVLEDTGIRNGEVTQVFRGRNAALADLAILLGPPLGRTVLDRTGLTGRFNFDFWVAPVETAGGPLLLFRSMPRATSPTIFAALADAGLRLEPSRAPLEVLVIDRVEKPTPN